MIVVVLSPEPLDLVVDAPPDLNAASSATLSRGPGPDMTAMFSSAILRLSVQLDLGFRNQSRLSRMAAMMSSAILRLSVCVGLRGLVNAVGSV